MDEWGGFYLYHFNIIIHFCFVICCLSSIHIETGGLGTAVLCWLSPLYHSFWSPIVNHSSLTFHIPWSPSFVHRFVLSFVDCRCSCLIQSWSFYGFLVIHQRIIIHVQFPLPSSILSNSLNSIGENFDLFWGDFVLVKLTPLDLILLSLNLLGLLTAIKVSQISVQLLIYDDGFGCNVSIIQGKLEFISSI